MTFLHRESGLTSPRCSSTREPWPTDCGSNRHVATEMLAGEAQASTDWHSINWKAVYRNVRRSSAYREGGSGGQVE